MILRRLSLTNFKNIASADLDLSPGINCFLGGNGMGKTNLLDAVYFLSFTKSHTGAPDVMLISHDADFATLRGEYQRRDSTDEVTVGLLPGRRKSFRLAGKEYRRLSEHIGRFPLVMVSPSDHLLVNGTGEERRRWADSVLSQSSARYLDNLMRYNHALESRNKMLRDGITDPSLYAAVETVMDMTASVIHSTRVQWAERVRDKAVQYYRIIAGEGCEEVDIRFEGSLDNSTDGSLASLMDEARNRDIILRHTTVGPHRDDFVLSANSLPMRRAASQGQCKTLTTALRLAQFDFLRENSTVTPILLLDDIFDKLDASRVGRIMELVASPRFGQIFITDTNRHHLDEIIGRARGDKSLWDVDSGVFTPSAL